MSSPGDGGWRAERAAAALEEFHRWSGYLGLGAGGHGSGVFGRLQAATRAVREWRMVSNTRGGDAEMVVLAVRVVADGLAAAAAVEAAAGAGQDPGTVAWVAAGLRCPAQPFCVGCTSCQTVTSPLRPCDPPVRGPFA